MRENTATRTATTYPLMQLDPQFASLDAETKAEMAQPYVWPTVEKAEATVDRMVNQNGFEHEMYVMPGQTFHVFYVKGSVLIVIVIEDDDLTRVHTALMTGRELSIRYVKADGEVTRRRVQPQSLRFSKAGDAILRATDNRRDGESRSFRWDRVTHTTLHRTVRRPAPGKSALWAEFERTLPTATVGEYATAVTAPAITGQVRHTRRDYTGVVVEGSRAYSASGWSVIVKLDADHAHLTPSGTVRASEDELEAWVIAVTDVYDTTPGTPAALEASEAVQDQLAERYARGYRYAFITV